MPQEKRKRRWFLIGTLTAVLLLAILAALQLQYTKTDVYAENMALAAESREKGDYDSALRALRKAAAERESEECLLLMADCYEEQGNLEKALEILRGILAKYGLTTEALLLEVTESAYAQDVDYMLAVVGQLRDAGFRIEMDDFGSGYSSLNMLCLMPIDILKIDMKFVQNLMTTADGYHVLELVVNLSHTLHLPALVEGVEDQAQYDLVRKAGCDIVQGYYFSRPVEAAAFEQLIREAQEKGTLGV